MSEPPEGDISGHVWEAQLLRYHGVGALVFLIWDTMITFADEVQYIWPQSRRSPTKWVFLFTRYFGLLAQARLVCINLDFILGFYSMDVCRMLYISQVAFGGVLMACIQSILMLRVYALYIQDRRVAFAMISLLVAEIGSMPGVIHLTLPTTAGNMCMKHISIRDVAFFGVSALLPQFLVLGLTVVKFLSGLRAGWGKIPIVSRLVRDDIILVSVIVAWVIITASLTSISTVYGYVGYYWLLSLIPSVGCRVVINMQRLADESTRSGKNNYEGVSPSMPQFTSIIVDTLSGSRSAISDINPLSHSPSYTHSLSSDPIKTAPRDNSAHFHSHLPLEAHANPDTSYAAHTTVKNV